MDERLTSITNRFAAKQVWLTKHINYEIPCMVLW